MLRYQATNAQHIGSRSYQEDYFAILDPVAADERERYGLLSVLADGMGGMSHGDAAAQLAVKAFVDSYREKAAGEPAGEALLRAARTANASVNAEARKRRIEREMGTTLVATAVAGDALHWISVGDSGLFLLREGRLTRLNRPHIFANVLEERLARGEVTREQALLHPQREALTSYVGGAEIQEIDQNAEPLPLHEGDVVLLASDGLFKSLSPAEIAKTLREAVNPAETLVQRAVVSGGLRQDNVTVIAIQAGEKAAGAAARALSEEETAEIEGGARGKAAEGAGARRLAVALLALAAVALAVYWLR